MVILSGFFFKELIYNNKKYKYYRPNQAREIPLTSRSNRGFMPSLKPHIEGLILDYESQLEKNFLLLLDHDPNCVDLQPQPVAINYITKSGKEATIYPDCWAYFIDGTEYLFEIKPEYKYRKLIESEDWNLRVKEIQEFCKKRGWIYQVITEQKINSVRLNNVKDLITAAKHFSPSNFKGEMGNFLTYLKKFLQTPKNFKTLPSLLEPTVPLKLEEIISFLKYHIYFQHIYIDWDKPLENTDVSLTDDHPLVPIYKMPNNPSVNINSFEFDNEESKKKLKIYSEKDLQKFKERYELLKPILNKLGKEAKKSEIRSYCNENKKSFHLCYKYYLIYKREGEKGLYPHRSKKHNKSHLDPNTEKLLQDALYNYNHGNWTQIKGAFDEFERKCGKQGLESSSYQTFVNRVHSLPASEKRGKYCPKTQSFISQGLNGTYQEGRYPGCVIQMDHTELDIWLVDALTKQPMGRPWLTLGADTFSRSLWGFFLSFDSPSSETVTSAIINGLTIKEKLLEWRLFEAQKKDDGFEPSQYKWLCAGFPGTIQVDNSQEFGANNVLNFCIKNNITLEFPPVKLPNYGGYIESTWNTINTAILNAKLPGRIFSLPKSRQSVSRPKFIAPPNYDPKKEACLTLDEFREWLFNYFIVQYLVDLKANQNHSPNDTWTNGIKGENYQPLGGALRTLDPIEYEHYEFDAKIEFTAVLTQKGFRHHYIYYTSEWTNEARKNKIIFDKKKYALKISHWDIRKVFIKNPQTDEIETLVAYNYEGDDRVWEFISMGLGNIHGYKPFQISLKDLIMFKKRLGNSKYDEKEQKAILEEMNEKILIKGKTNMKERKKWERMSKDKNEKSKLKEKLELCKMDDSPIPTYDPNQDVVNNSNINDDASVNDIQKEDLEFIIPCETDWDDVKKEMTFSYDYKNNKEEE